MIYNCATSKKNKISFDNYASQVMGTAKFFSFNYKVTRANLKFVRSDREFKIKKAIFQDIPLVLLKGYSRLPFLGSPQLRKDVEQLTQVDKKMMETIGIFEFFMKGDYEYENERIYQTIKILDPVEKEEFAADCT